MAIRNLASGRQIVDCVAYYKMDDNVASTTVLDYALPANNGTFNDATGNPNTSSHTTTGKVGNALTFDGTDDYIDCGSGSSINISSGGISVVTWVKRSGISTSQRILHKGGQSNSNYDFAVGFTSSNNVFWGAQATTDAMANGIATTSTYTSLTDWVHIVGTYSGSTVLIYVNGVLQATSSSSTSNTATTNLHIGQKNDGTQRLNGTLDDIKIYKKVLTAEEIYQLYSGTK